MLLTVRRVLQALLVLNWVAVFAFVALGILLSVAPAGLESRLTDRFGTQADALRHGMIAVLLIGSLIAIPVHVIFVRLIAMIDTVRLGRPFSPANVARLRHIAWAVLAIQIADLAFGWVSLWLARTTGEAIGWQFSLTGWLSVLLLFVLARVFQQGAAMQDEIEATV